MIKSPLRYPGGKSRAVKLISSLLPNFDEYREPFLGGGSIFIYLKQMYPEKKYWINDKHYSLFKFWEMCQKDVRAVIEKVYQWRNQFSDGKKLHIFLTKNIPTFNDVETAAAFFIFNRITFSGTSESGGYSQQAYHGRFTESSIQRLLEMGMLLNGATITNYDYKKLVDDTAKNVFIYLDPPYYGASKSALYGKNGNLHKNFDHAGFAEAMRNCEHKWLITYDDCNYIRDLFSFATIIPWDLTYGMRNQTPTSNQTGKELFISNYLPVSNYNFKIEKERQFVLFEPRKRYKRSAVKTKSSSS